MELSFPFDRTADEVVVENAAALAWMVNLGCRLSWGEVPDAELGDFTLRTVPDRFARLGDVGAGINEQAHSLEPLLELVQRHEAEGLGDAPWPPNYVKHPGEPPRVQPSKRRMPLDPSGLRPSDPTAPRGRAGSVAPATFFPPARRADGTVSPTGRRRSSQPLRVVALAETKEEAMDGLDRWRERWPEASAHVGVEDVLVDGMRGRSSLWYRVRVNLRHVPEPNRPPNEKPDPDYDPWEPYRQPEEGRPSDRATRPCGALPRRSRRGRRGPCRRRHSDV